MWARSDGGAMSAGFAIRIRPQSRLPPAAGSCRSLSADQLARAARALSAPQWCCPQEARALCRREYVLAQGRQRERRRDGAPLFLAKTATVPRAFPPLPGQWPLARLGLHERGTHRPRSSFRQACALKMSTRRGGDAVEVGLRSRGPRLQVGTGTDAVRSFQPVATHPDGPPAPAPTLSHFYSHPSRPYTACSMDRRTAQTSPPQSKPSRARKRRLPVGPNRLQQLPLELLHLVSRVAPFRRVVRHTPSTVRRQSRPQGPVPVVLSTRVRLGQQICLGCLSDSTHSRARAPAPVEDHKGAPAG